MNSSSFLGRKMKYKLAHYLMLFFDKVEPYLYKIDLILERKRRRKIYSSKTV